MKNLFWLALLILISSCARNLSRNPAPPSELKRKPAVANPITYLANIRQQMQGAWPDNRTINIVCHGHSVPSGYFKTPKVDTFNAYPYLLHRALKEQYPNAVINVIVTAIGGEHSQSGAARFESQVLTHKPDVLLIDYAINDRNIGLEKAKESWISMIEEALTQNVKIILLTPNPILNTDPKNPLDQHAEQIRKLAAEYNIGLTDSFIKYHKYKQDGGSLKNLMSHPFHPNRKGHELIAEELIKWFLPP